MGTVPHEDISIAHKGNNKNLLAALAESSMTTAGVGAFSTHCYWPLATMWRFPAHSS